MTKTDTSREAVEAFIQGPIKEGVISEGLPRTKEDTETDYMTVDLLRALVTERDALQARAERAEAALGSVMHLLDGEAWDFARATLAQLDAEPAGFATTEAEERWCEDVENACPHCGGSGHKGDVPELKVKDNIYAVGSLRDFMVLAVDFIRGYTCEFAPDPESHRSDYDYLTELFAECFQQKPAGVYEPAGVRMKPLEWKDNKASTPFGDYSIHQTPDGYEVIDPEGEEIVHVGFNSDPIRSAYRLAQEFVQADCEQRILAALEPGQTHREGWEQAKEAAAECVERKNTNNVGMVHPVAASDADTIRAMPYPGDSQ